MRGYQVTNQRSVLEYMTNQRSVFKATDQSQLCVSALLEHYRSIAQREKIEKESRRFLGRKLSYLQLSDKYGLTTVVARKRAGLPPHASAGGKTEDLGRQVDIAPAEAVDLDDENDLPESLMTDPLDLFRYLIND